MANYIGYDSEVDVEQVDWSAITTDLVKGIKTEDERRFKKKGEIEKASDDLITEISDHQQAIGSDTTYNAYVLDAAEQAKEFALMQNRLMKRGQLKPSAVVRSTQILSDDWKSFEQISKTFQDTDAAARKAQEAGLSKLGESSYGDFLKEVDINNSRLVVGPEDGRLYFQGKDGKLMNMSSINNRVADLPKDFEIIDSTKKFTDSLGKTIRRDGKGGTIGNIRNEKGFINSQKSYIESINADPRNTLSVLTQNGYELTQDPDKVDANTILIKPDENGLLQPVLSDANISASNAILQDRIDGQLDLIFSAENQQGADGDRTDQLKGDQYKNVANLFSTDQGLRGESANLLLQNFPHVNDIDINKQGINVKYNDASKPAIPINFVRSGTKEDGDRIYNTPEQMTDQIIAALVGPVSPEELSNFKKAFKKTDEYEKMIGTFEMEIGAIKQADLQKNYSRPSTDLRFTEQQLSDINENSTGTLMYIQGRGNLMVQDFNTILQSDKASKGGLLSVQMIDEKKGTYNIIFTLNGKDYNLGSGENSNMESGVTTAEIAAQIKNITNRAGTNPSMATFNTPKVN